MPNNNSVNLPTGVSTFDEGSLLNAAELEMRVYVTNDILRNLNDAAVTTNMLTFFKPDDRMDHLLIVAWVKDSEDKTIFASFYCFTIKDGPGGLNGNFKHSIGIQNRWLHELDFSTARLVDSDVDITIGYIPGMQPEIYEGPVIFKDAVIGDINPWEKEVF